MRKYCIIVVLLFPLFTIAQQVKIEKLKATVIVDYVLANGGFFEHSLSYIIINNNMYYLGEGLGQEWNNNIINIYPDLADTIGNIFNDKLIESDSTNDIRLTKYNKYTTELKGSMTHYYVTGGEFYLGERGVYSAFEIEGEFVKYTNVFDSIQDFFIRKQKEDMSQYKEDDYCYCPFIYRKEVNRKDFYVVKKIYNVTTISTNDALKRNMIKINDLKKIELFNCDIE